MRCNVVFVYVCEQTVMECLHRFCSGCIEKSIRLGLNECPKCRVPIPTKRYMRADPGFDALISLLVGHDPAAIERAESERIQRIVDTHTALHREHSELVQHRLESQSSTHRADARDRARREREREVERAAELEAAHAAYIKQYGHPPPPPQQQAGGAAGAAGPKRGPGRPRSTARADFEDPYNLHLPSRREQRAAHAKSALAHYQALTLAQVLRGPPSTFELRNHILLQPLHQVLAAMPSSTVLTAQSLNATIGFYCTEHASTAAPFRLAKHYLQTPGSFTVAHLAKLIKLKLMTANQRTHSDAITATHMRTAAAHRAPGGTTPQAMAATSAAAARSIAAANAQLQTVLTALDAVDWRFTLVLVPGGAATSAAAAATALASASASSASSASSSSSSASAAAAALAVASPALVPVARTATTETVLLPPTITIGELQQHYVNQQPPPPPPPAAASASAAASAAATDSAAATAPGAGADRQSRHLYIIYEMVEKGAAAPTPAPALAPAPVPAPAPAPALPSHPQPSPASSLPPPPPPPPPPAAAALPLPLPELPLPLPPLPTAAGAGAGAGAGSAMMSL
jgi:hypothetical protein